MKTIENIEDLKRILPILDLIDNIKVDTFKMLSKLIGIKKERLIYIKNSYIADKNLGLECMLNGLEKDIYKEYPKLKETLKEWISNECGEEILKYINFVEEDITEVRNFIKTYRKD